VHCYRFSLLALLWSSMLFSFHDYVLLAEIVLFWNFVSSFVSFEIHFLHMSCENRGSFVCCCHLLRLTLLHVTFEIIVSLCATTCLSDHWKLKMSVFSHFYFPFIFASQLIFLFSDLTLLSYFGVSVKLLQKNFSWLVCSFIFVQQKCGLHDFMRFSLTCGIFTVTNVLSFRHIENLTSWI